MTAMRSLSASALALGAKGAALTVALALAFAFLPVVSLAVVPFLPLPTAYVCLRQGGMAAAISAVAASLMAGIISGVGSGLFTFALAVLAGVALGLALRRNRGFSGVLLATAVATAAGLVLWVGGVWVVTGMTVEQFGALMDTSFQAVAQMYAGMNMDAEAVAQAEEGARSMLAMLPYLAPGIVASVGVALAALTLALASLLFPRLGHATTPALSFHEFRLHWATPYGFILGLLLILMAGWWPHGGEAARLAGINLVLFFATLFFVQGFAVARWFMLKRGVKGGAAVAFYGAALLGQVFFQLLSWVGVVDCWLDFRKRMTPKLV